MIKLEHVVLSANETLFPFISGGHAKKTCPVMRIKQKGVIL